MLTPQAFEAGVRGTPEAPGMADGSRGLSSSTAQGASVASTVTIASPTSSAPMWRLLIHCQNVELAAVGQNDLAHDHRRRIGLGRQHLPEGLGDRVWNSVSFAKLTGSAACYQSCPLRTSIAACVASTRFRAATLSRD